MKFKDYINEAGAFKPGKKGTGSKSFDTAIKNREKAKQKFFDQVIKAVQKMGGNPKEMTKDDSDRLFIDDKSVRDAAKEIYQTQVKLGTNLK